MHFFLRLCLGCLDFFFNFSTYLLLFYNRLILFFSFFLIFKEYFILCLNNFLLQEYLSLPLFLFINSYLLVNWNKYYFEICLFLKHIYNLEVFYIKSSFDLVFIQIQKIEVLFIWLRYLRNEWRKHNTKNSSLECIYNCYDRENNWQGNLAVLIPLSHLIINFWNYLFSRYRFVSLKYHF